MSEKKLDFSVTEIDWSRYPNLSEVIKDRAQCTSEFDQLLRDKCAEAVQFIHDVKSEELTRAREDGYLKGQINMRDRAYEVCRDYTNRYGDQGAYSCMNNVGKLHFLAVSTLSSSSAMSRAESISCSWVAEDGSSCECGRHVRFSPCASAETCTCEVPPQFNGHWSMCPLSKSRTP